MSYKNRLECYGRRVEIGEARPYVYFYDADRLKTVEEVARADHRAEQDIKTLETIIADLREYRQALAARYAGLETMVYKSVLKLERVPHWQGHINYFVTIDRVFEDGTTTTELREVFPGKQRRDAIKRFEELKKQRPGIEAVKDIAKRDWER